MRQPRRLQTPRQYRMTAGAAAAGGTDLFPVRLNGEAIAESPYGIVHLLSRGGGSHRRWLGRLRRRGNGTARATAAARLLLRLTAVPGQVPSLSLLVLRGGGARGIPRMLRQRLHQFLRPEGGIQIHDDKDQEEGSILLDMERSSEG
jgi:hypothetical protein